VIKGVKILFLVNDYSKRGCQEIMALIKEDLIETDVAVGSNVRVLTA
jgi:hypothetical protein